MPASHTAAAWPTTAACTVALHDGTAARCVDSKQHASRPRTHTDTQRLGFSQTLPVRPPYTCAVQWTCTITATLTASGAPLNGVSISGTWSSPTNSWTAYDATAVVTSSTGAARFTCKAYTATSSTANKCTFTTDADRIALPPGYALVTGSALFYTLSAFWECTPKHVYFVCEHASEQLACGA